MKRSTSIAVLLLLLSLYACMGTTKQDEPDNVWKGQPIAHDNQSIVIEGAMHLTYEKDRVVINRHSDQLWSGENIYIDKKTARTQSGVRVIFKTDSKIIRLLFSVRNDGQLRDVTNYYGIYKNGEFFDIKKGDNLTLTSSGQVVEWEIVLPISYSVDFKGLVVDEEAKLLEVKRAERPVYVAIGNSITHGAGQKECGSDGTYPYILAKSKGYDMYNLAVGGSQITPAIAKETEGIKADVITVMWGYNDWNSNVDIDKITRRYDALLVELRKYQPDAKIYCILPSTAKFENGSVSKPHLNAVRDAERQLVESFQAKGDNKLFLIDGGEISSVNMLDDNVHFSNDGASLFGKALVKLID